MTVTEIRLDVRARIGDAPSTRRARQRLPASRHPAFAGCILTPREMATMRHMAHGLTYAEAAREMNCTLSTVRTLLHTAYGRLGVRSIAEALAVCTGIGWLDNVPDDGFAVEHADRRVSWAQRLYLEAFEQSLRAGDDPAEIARTGALRNAALTGMYNEAALHRPPHRQASTTAHLRIVETLRRLDADRLPAVRPGRRPESQHRSSAPRRQTAGAR